MASGSPPIGVRLVNVVDKSWRGLASRCRKGDAEAMRWRSELVGYSLPHYKPFDWSLKTKMTSLLAILQIVSI
jgi:hypothetical protein